MSDVRVKTIFKDDRLLNDFLSLKDIELVEVNVRPMEYVVLYKKIKKTAKKVEKDG